MKINSVAFLFLTTGLAFGQIIIKSQKPPVVVPDAELEMSNKTNPDNTFVTGRLLQYLAVEQRDKDWSARFPLITWNVDKHPDAYFFGDSMTYAGLPDGLRAQLKQSWVNQVQLHPDNPNILRNAALALSPPTPAVIRVGGNVQKVNLIQEVQPEYPEMAKQARVQGVVRLSVTIGMDGTIVNASLVSGHPLLVQAALEAVRQYRYKPTLLNGNATSIITTVDVNFTLPS